MNRLKYVVFGILLIGLAAVPSMRAQGINPRQPPPPPPASPADTPPSSTPATPQASPAHADSASAKAPPIDPTVPPPPPPAEDAAPETPPEPKGPVFDPLHARRSMDVGTFYMNKGIYDAAIDRFLEAANYQPSLAAPWKMLGEAYEKKRDYSKAIDAYNKYLSLMPHASDAAKIKKTVSELEKSSQESPKKAENQ